MGGRSPKAIEFRSKLGFTQYDKTLKKESSVLRSIMETFEGENMETQYSVLSYKVDLYFHDYNLAIEIDEKEHNHRNQDYEKQREELIKKELNCVFIRINPDEENFKISKVNNRISRHIKRLTKESTQNKMINDVEKIPKIVKQLCI